MLRRCESDALGVQEVQQLGGTQPDTRHPEPRLQVVHRERLVLQHASIQRRVRQDEGVHSLDFFLLAHDRLRRRETLAVGAVLIRVAQLRVGPGGSQSHAQLHAVKSYRGKRHCLNTQRF